MYDIRVYCKKIKKITKNLFKIVPLVEEGEEEAAVVAEPWTLAVVEEEGVEVPWYTGAYTVKCKIYHIREGIL